MTKRKLRNYCADQIAASDQDALLFMDRKKGDNYAAFFTSVTNPDVFHLVLAYNVRSKTPVVHRMTYTKKLHK